MARTGLMVANLGKNWRMTRTGGVREGQRERRVSMGRCNIQDGRMLQLTQEEDVGNTSELLEQVLKDEIVDGILCGQDLICSIGDRRDGLSLVIEEFIRKRFVEVDGSMSRRWSLFLEEERGIELNSLYLSP